MRRHNGSREARRGGLRLGFAWVLCPFVIFSTPVFGQSAPSPVGNPNGVLGAGLRGGGRGGETCNVPTDGTASPLFGAAPFSQHLLRVEDLGTFPLPKEEEDPCADPAACSHRLEAPVDVGGNPDPYISLTTSVFDDAIVHQGLNPYPTKETNLSVPNPWQSAIETTHTGPLMPLKEGALSSFADGRPPGPQYGHQRYEELLPTRYLQSGVTGARVNPGTRDPQQRHAYAAGEFAPGGMYHNTVHGLAAGVCASLTTRQACEAEAHPQTVASDKLCSWGQDSCSGKFDGSTEGIPVRFHPAMPVQDSQAVWTFEGTLPPKLLSTRYGEPLLFRNYNALPIKFEGNRGFGSHFITTHEHNGHVGAESDGYAEAFFLPGQFYDYHWPMLLAGHDSINRDAQDGRASAPCQPGETLEISFPSPGADANGEVCSRAEGLSENPTRTDSGVYTDSEACGWRKQLELCPASGAGAGHIGIPGDWRETMSTHWFHDHMIDYTAQNVYKGNAAMMNYYSGVDRGNECLEDGVNLRFPSGCGMDPWSWGNRDYDVLLVMASKAWGQDDSRYPGTSVADTRGQLWFNPFNTDGFIGDQMTVNWLWRPYLDVRARSYRFRLVNGDVSRFMVFAVVVERDDERGEFAADRPGISYDRVPIYMIANDGNIMEHAVPFDGSIDLDSDGDLQDHNGILPTQSIAERYDVIIDFERYAPGSKLYVVNLLEHDNGKRPERQIPLADVLAGRYGDCDSAVGTVLEFRVHAYAGVDRSMDPRRYVPGNENGAEGAPLKMIPLPEIGDEELLAAHHRTFELGRGAVTDSVPVNITPASFTSASPAPGLEGLFDFDVNGRSVDTTENAALPERPRKRWGILTDGMGSMRASNFNQVVAAPEIGALEIWHLINEGNGWSHNMHIHFEEGRILTRDGEPPPEWEKWARKDVYRVGRMDDSGSEVSVAIRFREFAGSYMEHCHNTQHEDTAMLMRWDVENPGQLKPFLLPENQWNGCTYTESVELLTASSQRAERVGNPDAKAAYELVHSAAALLCPGGATEDCPGVDSGPAPVATLIPPPVTTSPTPVPPVVSEPDSSVDSDDDAGMSEGERRRAARKAAREARKAQRQEDREVRRAARRAEREVGDSERETDRAAERAARHAERRARRLSGTDQ